MKILFKIIVGFLAIVGALTIALAAYLYFVDPFGLKPILSGQPAKPATSSGTQNAADLFPNLTPLEVYTLEKMGLDLEKVPTTITPEMEDCFVEFLGQDRVNEIKAGAAPTPTDFLRGKACLAQ